MTLPIRPDIIELEDSKIVDVWQHGLARSDLVMLAVGEGDLPTPKFIADAAYQAMLAGETFYTHKRGIPDLRRALARYHARHWGTEIADERIAVTSAGMNAMMLAAEIAIGAGDNMVAISPVWPNIFATAEIMGGEVRMIPLYNDGHGWHLDLGKLLGAVDGRTKVIYAATPGNPTGWTMSEAELATVIDFCRERNIWFIADEVYNRLVYDRREELVEIEMPAGAIVAQGDHAHLAAHDLGGGENVRPDGADGDHIVAGADGDLRRQHHGVHASRGDGDALLGDLDPPVAPVIAGERLAQLGDAALWRVEGLAAQH